MIHIDFWFSIRWLDFYNLIDHLSSMVRTAIDSDSSSDDLFVPYEWSLPVLLIFLQDAQHSSEFAVLVIQSIHLIYLKNIL